MSRRPAFHTRASDSRVRRDLLDALHEKQREVRGTPCQADPDAWDAPGHASKATQETAEWAASQCLNHCRAFDECSRLAENSPDLRGVIAGQLLGFPKPPGRPARGKKNEQEN